MLTMAGGSGRSRIRMQCGDNCPLPKWLHRKCGKDNQWPKERRVKGFYHLLRNTRKEKKAKERSIILWQGQLVKARNEGNLNTSKALTSKSVCHLKAHALLMQNPNVCQRMWRITLRAQFVKNVQAFGQFPWSWEIYICDLQHLPRPLIIARCYDSRTWHAARLGAYENYARHEKVTGGTGLYPEAGDPQFANLQQLQMGPQVVAFTSWPLLTLQTLPQLQPASCKL